MQTNRKKIRVIDSIWTLIVAICVIGPFALPLLWRNPRFKWSTKIFWSLVIVAVTFFCIWVLKWSANLATQDLQQLKQLQQLGSQGLLGQ